MEHQKIYELIIRKAKSENRIKLRRNNKDYVYYELHHILPKCLGGKDESNNLVLLTSREHYICHKLLTYIYKGNRSLTCALHKMTYGTSNLYVKSSRDYAYVTELMRNTPISDETRDKKCKSVGNILAKLGDLNPAKRSDVKESISIKLKGKFKGDNNPMAKSSRKRENLKLLEEKGIQLKGDTHEYLRRKILCTNIETNEVFPFDGVQSLLKTLQINKRKYYSHLKDGKPILDKYICEVL